MKEHKIQGFNTEVAIGPHRYHVQTELVSGRVVTLIFENGAVIGGRKTELITGEVDKDEDAVLERVKGSMMEQHRAMVESLKRDMTPDEKMEEEGKKVEEDKDLIKKFLEEWAGE